MDKAVKNDQWVSSEEDMPDPTMMTTDEYRFSLEARAGV